MTEELEQLLKNLKLHRMHAVYDEQLRAADLQQITYTDFVAGLLRAQWRDRQEGALEWRIRRALLPERWSLETFPYAKQPGVNRKQIRAFAELEYLISGFRGNRSAPLLKHWTFGAKGEVATARLLTVALT